MFKTQAKIILTILGIFCVLVFWGCPSGKQKSKESTIDQNSKASHSVLGLKADKPTWPSIDDSPRIANTIFGTAYNVHIIKGDSFGKASEPIKIYIDPAFYTFLHNSEIAPFQKLSPEQIKQHFEALFYSSLSIEFVNSAKECDIEISVTNLSPLSQNLIALTFPMKFWILKMLRDHPGYSQLQRFAQHLGKRLGLDLGKQGMILFNSDSEGGFNLVYNNLIEEGDTFLEKSVFADYLLVNLCINHELGHCFGLAHPNQLKDTYSLEDIGITPVPKKDLTIPSIMIDSPDSDLFKWIYDNHNLDMKAKMRMMDFNTNDKKYIFRKGNLK